MSGKNEDRWTRDYLVPLLKRLGFRKVELTHGTLETGRDLVFADVDRFGLLRYYAAQVKDGDIRSRTETQELRKIISQVQNAYETPYRDIATGTEHRMSGVYLIANGAITEAAKQILFEKVGSWLHILDGSQLQIAESLNIIFTERDRRGRYVALKLELMNNRTTLEERLPLLQEASCGQVTEVNIGGRLLRVRSLERVFDIAVMELHPDDLLILSAFLWLTETINFMLLKFPTSKMNGSAIRPMLVGLVDKINDYLKHLDSIDRLIDYVLESEEPGPGNRLGCSKVNAELMNRSNKLGTIEQGVRQAVENCLKVQPGEKALVITDQQTIEIGFALKAAIEKIAGKVEFFVMEDFGTRPIDLPGAIEEAIRSADVSIYAAQGAEGELQSFRKPMIDAVEANPALRHAHMTGITPQIMCDGMCSDYKQIQRISRLVYEKVKDAERIEVVTEKGCDFTAWFSPELKWLCEDGDIRPDHWLNLPDGEVCTCPIDVKGTAVIDGCLGDFFAQKYGYLGDTPITIEIENGRAIRESIECADEQLRKKFTDYLFENDENSNRVGEFAIGTNTGLTKLINNILQDEKFPGIHIAFGSPAPSRTGADWDCSTHVDGVIISPTIIVDGDTIMDKGQFRLE